MQHASDNVERSKAHQSFGAIVSDLFSLVEHVRAGINLIERAIVREMTVGDHESSNIIVLGRRYAALHEDIDRSEQLQREPRQLGAVPP
jgi:hypothetical protein